jgi:predicted nucleotidyltransferase component of viral defense system
MLSLDEIKKFYPDHLKRFDRFLLREYLQYKILEIVFDSKYANRLSFLGGTCLRIVHGNTRFSEDLDFDNFNLSEPEFFELSEIIYKKLSAQGYGVEIKNVMSGAFHCYVRFPKLLFKENLSGHLEEKILIQLDTEPHDYAYKPQKYILNKFDVFISINVTPPEILLAQKFYALINRKRKKGRDFYDIIFLLKTTRPDYDYLKQKINIDNGADLKNLVLSVLKDVDLKTMADDVKKFLFYPDDVKQIIFFREYIDQIF